MNADTTHVELTTEIGYFSILQDRHLQLAAAEGLWHIRGLAWATDRSDLPAGDDLLASIAYRREGASEHIVRVGDALIWLRLDAGGKLGGRVAVDDTGDLADAFAWIKRQLPEAGEPDGVAVRINFRHWECSMAQETERLLDVTTWDASAGSYAERTRAALDPLMHGFEPNGRGRLLLWHGAPGTGKTTAIRAVAWEWRAWCDVHYITDPEVLFGQVPGYMVQLLTDRDDDDERWRLLVLEDTGELMRHDAKHEAGQGLSRLLNLVDGLIGQGFPVLVLVTTNEPLGALHDAVARPGRCLSNIEFEELPAEHAQAWLRERGCDAQVDCGVTLAECYAVLSGEELPARRPIGFVTSEQQSVARPFR